MAAIVVSFVAFASDEARHGSQETVARLDTGAAVPAPPTTRAALNEPSPRPPVERLREQEHAPARELVDDVDDVLLAPFAGLGGDSLWARRIVEGLAAFVVFGIGLGFLSRYAATRGV